MSGIPSRVVMAVAAVSLALPMVASAQTSTWKDVQVSDIETMRDKFIALAGAFDESQYDWRPMEGVRSVREVLSLAVAEANLFPGLWGIDAPAGAAEGFGPEMERVGAMGKTAIVEELGRSFEHLVGAVRGMDEAKRMSESSFFGRAMPTHANVATAMGDMHEHLGQLIAYARTNKVVPPWSR
jgi:hypothetical protein